MSKRREEIERRRMAHSHQGEVIAGSGKPLEASNLEQMVSVRLDADTVAHLRRISSQRNISLSALIRDALGNYVESASFTSDIRWRVTRYEGVVTTGAEWNEEPRSRSSLRELKDGATTT